jgi:hypothetical protein
LVSNIGCELVSSIGGSSNTPHDETGIKVLAQDEKFMTLLESIRDNMHNNFDRGYKWQGNIITSLLFLLMRLIIFHAAFSIPVLLP